VNGRTKERANQRLIKPKHSSDRLPLRAATRKLKRNREHCHLRFIAAALAAPKEFLLAKQSFIAKTPLESDL